jgi:hypothetical protein
MSCTGQNTPTIPTPTQANITLTLSPNPATATICCGDSDFPYYATVTGTLTIQEIAGIGGNIDTISVGGTGATSSAVNYEASGIVRLVGTNRVGGKASFVFPLSWSTGLLQPNANRPFTLSIYVAVTDDRGNHVSATTQWTAS